MYNFTSATINLGGSHKRSKSLTKVGDNSPFLNSPCEKSTTFRITKLSEFNSAFLPNSSLKTGPKPKRPPTADAYVSNPQKNSGCAIRSPSPVGFASVNNSVRSTGTLIPYKSLPNSVVYDAIKSQTKQFFSRTAVEIPSVAPIIKDLSKQDISQHGLTPVMTSRDFPNTTHREIKSSSIGVSPRKRLALQPNRMFSVKAIKLKDAMKETLNALSKTRIDRNQERPRTRSKQKHGKKDKSEEDDGKTPVMIARERQLAEEKKVIEGLEKTGCEKFYEKLNLYNKFYSDYIYEPDVKFVTQDDLKVEVKLRINENGTPPQDIKRVDTKKKTTIVQKNNGPRKSTILLKDLTNGDNYKRSVIERQEALKLELEKSRRTEGGGRKGVEWAYEIDGEAEEGNSGIKSWKLFGNDMASVENNLRSLEKINGLIMSKGELNTEEKAFFKFVKEGNEIEVQSMLRMNMDLVKIRDLRNQTPLHWAIKRGYLAIVEELVDYGADLEAADIAGRKPLDLVEGLNRKEIINVVEQSQWKMKRKAVIHAN